MSNLTVTIFSEEYRDLLKTQCKYEMLLNMILGSSYLSSYDNDLSVSSSDVLKIVKEFAPMESKLRLEELKRED